MLGERKKWHQNTIIAVVVVVVDSQKADCIARYFKSYVDCLFTCV